MRIFFGKIEDLFLKIERACSMNEFQGNSMMKLIVDVMEAVYYFPHLFFFIFLFFF